MKTIQSMAVAAILAGWCASASGQSSAHFRLEAASSQPTAQTCASGHFLLEGSIGNTFSQVSTNSMREIAAGIVPHRFPAYLGEPFIDTDADGLADGWEMFCFGKLAQTASDDPDGDGYPNSHEQLAATDPLNPTSLFRTTAFAKAGAEIKLCWHGRPLQDYRVYFSANLAPPWELVAVVPTDEYGDASHGDTDPARTSQTCGFYRVELVRER